MLSRVEKEQGALQRTTDSEAQGGKESEQAQTQPKGGRQMLEESSAQQLPVKATPRSYCSSHLRHIGIVQ